MRKTRLSVAALVLTAALVWVMLAEQGMHVQPIANVKTCRVEIGQVEQVLAVNGVVRYETEYVALCPVTGVVDQVYVQAGEQVRAGQPLFRMDGEAQAATASAMLQAGDWLATLLPGKLPAAQLQDTMMQLDSLTVRAAGDGVVQQVLVSPCAGVMVGTSAVLLSGGQQEIVCSVVQRDARELRPGMSARVVIDGAVMAVATVAEIGPVEISSTTGQMVCQVRLTPDRALKLPLGATVEVEMILYGENGVPVLPMEAITENDTVWWVADGRSYEIPAGVVMADEVSCWVDLPEELVVICGGDPPAEGGRIREMEQ